MPLSVMQIPFKLEIVTETKTTVFGPPGINMLRNQQERLQI